MKFLTIRDAAEALDVPEHRLRRDIRDGKTPHMKLGNRAVIDVDAVRALYPKRETINIQELSRQTGLTQGAIRRAIRAGWMPHLKPGKGYEFELDRVNEAIAARVAASSGKPGKKKR